MKYTFSLIAFSFLVLGLSSCGQSPMFNHVNAGETTKGSTQETQPSAKEPQTLDCAVSLKKEKLCVKMQWVTKPTEEEKGSFKLEFTDLTTGVAQDPKATVFVKLWMPAMGHGSSPTKTSRAEAGIYNVTDVFFVMPGAWEILVQLKEGNQVLEQAKFEHQQ